MNEINIPQNIIRLGVRSAQCERCDKNADNNVCFECFKQPRYIDVESIADLIEGKNEV